MTRNREAEAAPSGRAEAVGPPAAGGGLDLSLGHIGTYRFYACCDACHATKSEAEYQAAEAAEGLDPRCTRCGRSAWSFHEL